MYVSQGIVENMNAFSELSEEIVSCMMKLLKAHLCSTNVLYFDLMNCFCGLVERRKVLFLAWNIVRDPHHRISLISNTSGAGFEPTQNLSSGLVG